MGSEASKEYLLRSQVRASLPHSFSWSSSAALLPLALTWRMKSCYATNFFLSPGFLCLFLCLLANTVFTNSLRPVSMFQPPPTPKEYDIPLPLSVVHYCVEEKGLPINLTSSGEASVVALQTDRK